MNTKGSKKNIWSYFIWGVLLVVVLIPDTRIFVQRQLMKLGLFRPKLETSAQQEPEKEQQTISVTGGPAVSFVDDKGNPVHVRDLKGKVVFINFWATWCPPCKAEMPSIQKLYDKFKDSGKIEFLLVEIDNNIRGANDFLKGENLDLPIVYPYSDIPKDWLSDAIPTTVILDKEGKLIAREQGMRDYSASSVVDFMQNLINQ